MKRGLLIAASVIAMMSQSATAQQQTAENRHERRNQTVEQRAQRMTDRQAGDLSLSAEQRERLYEANLKLAESQRKIYEKRREEERERMADMQKHADKYDRKLREILTSEQYAKWQAAEQQRKEQMRRKRHDAAPCKGRPMGCKQAKGKCANNNGGDSRVCQRSAGN
ncbi:MAG: DUF4890 domain-containing protein [Alistipes sp.]